MSTDVHDVSTAADVARPRSIASPDDRRRAAEIERTAASRPTCSPSSATPGASGCRCRRATAASAPTSRRHSASSRPLARADASSAWTVMIGGDAWSDLAGLPRTTFDKVFDRPDVIVAGAFAPTGIDRPADGGLPGDRPVGFASGCEHADVLFANCVDEADGRAAHGRARAGRRASRTPGRRSGLSRHGQPPLPCRRPGGAGRPHLPALGRPAVPGCADRPDPGAHADLPADRRRRGRHRAGRARRPRGARGRQGAAARPARSRPTPRSRSTSRPPTPTCGPPGAARRDRRGECWGRGQALTLAQRARARAAADWVVARAAAVVDAAHAAGSTSVYAGSPLHRRLRDVHTLTQHFLVRRTPRRRGRGPRRSPAGGDDLLSVRPSVREELGDAVVGVGRRIAHGVVGIRRRVRRHNRSVGLPEGCRRASRWFPPPTPGRSCGRPGRSPCRRSSFPRPSLTPRSVAHPVDAPPLTVTGGQRADQSSVRPTAQPTVTPVETPASLSRPTTAPRSASSSARATISPSG